MKEQIPLIQQAKRDGVKRFVPSEFGIDPRAPAAQADFFKPKREVFAALKAADFIDGMIYDEFCLVFLSDQRYKES